MGKVLPSEIGFGWRWMEVWHPYLVNWPSRKQRESLVHQLLRAPCLPGIPVGRLGGLGSTCGPMNLGVDCLGDVGSHGGAHPMPPGSVSQTPASRTLQKVDEYSVCPDLVCCKELRCLQQQHRCSSSAFPLLPWLAALQSCLLLPLLLPKPARKMSCIDWLLLLPLHRNP